MFWYEIALIFFNCLHVYCLDNLFMKMLKKHVVPNWKKIELIIGMELELTIF